MEETFFIFVAGISGVFICMTLLYTAIRVMSFIVSREEKNTSFKNKPDSRKGA
ncbi:hypothetical protein QUF76_19405 [Desulfobacterales bacterium HSG16]|nr:hypothetical protein [Desulfobacterales bacterium HSG16]